MALRYVQRALKITEETRDIVKDLRRLIEEALKGTS